jgi:hypothetical protein
MAAFAVAGLVMASPWLVFNFVHYHALSASAQVDKITGPLQPRIPLSLAGFRVHLHNSRNGFWELQPYFPGSHAYGWYLDVTYIVAAVAGVVVALVRRRWSTAVMLAWLATALPWAFANMMLIVNVVFGKKGTGIGRHYYAALAPTVLLIVAAAIVAFGSRWGTVVLVVLLAFFVGKEQNVYRHYIQGAYEADIFGQAIPVVDQSWSDVQAPSAGLRIDPPCPVQAISIHTTEPQPTITIQPDGGQPVTLHVEADDRGFVFYGVRPPVTSPATVRFPRRIAVEASTQEREPAVAFIDDPRDPTARLFCNVDDPATTRFRAMFDSMHPQVLTRASVEGWAAAWAWLVRAVALATFLAAVSAQLTDRRRTAETVAGSAALRSDPTGDGSG